MTPRGKKDPLAVEWGKRVVAAMDSVGLTQRETARLLGMDENTFGGAIRGYHRFQLEIIPRLAEVLHRPISYFFGLPDPRGLSDEEQILVEIFRAYQRPIMREALLEDARHHLEIERAFLQANEG